MIKVNELRLGNWVNEKVLGDCRVVSIWELQASLNNGNDDADYAINAENLYPIPLTPEILLACGFKENEQGQGHEIEFAIAEWLVVNDLGVHISGDDAAYFTINCAFLHQLQNLYFALTGTELNYSPELLKPTNA